MSDLVYKLNTVSYYTLDGWVWCPDSPSAKVDVMLIDSSGVELASFVANRVCDNIPPPESHNEGYCFVFYGLFSGVDSIVFSYGDIKVSVPLQIEQPLLPASLSNYGFLVFHPDDYMLKFNIEREGIEKRIQAYINGGSFISAEVLNICTKYLTDRDKPYGILDFASGFGRVTRAFDKSTFNVTASDIHTDAVGYINRYIGVNTILSATNPKLFATDKKFDVVFAFSFFSHLPNKTLGNWIATLYGCLNPGGLLIFTTHGRLTKATNPIFVFNGYGFVYYSEQLDLKAKDYGSSITELSYVQKTLNKYIKQSPVYFEECATLTGGYQDLYVVKKKVYQPFWNNGKLINVLKAIVGRSRVLSAIKKRFIR